MYGDSIEDLYVEIGPNGPLTSSKNLHFQNEAKMSFICMRMKIVFISKAEHLTLF